MNVFIKQWIAVLVFGEYGHSDQQRQDEKKPKTGQVVVNGSLYRKGKRPNEPIGQIGFIGQSSLKYFRAVLTLGTLR